MENEVSRTTENDEGEVSLVDLLAVLIRHRKLVIGLPLAVTALLGLVVALGPRFLSLGSKAESTTQVTIPLDSMPQSLVGFIDFSASRILNRSLNSPSFILESYEACFPEDVRVLDRQGKLLFIKRNIIETKRLTWSYDEANATLSISFKKSDQEKASEFVRSLGGHVSEVLQADWADKTAAFKSVYEKEKQAYLKLPNGEERARVVPTLVPLSRAAAQADMMKQNQSYPINGGVEEVVVPVPTGNAKKLVLAFFAAFFVAVVAAFILDAIRKIQDDPTQSAVLRDAWNAGGARKRDPGRARHS